MKRLLCIVFLLLTFASSASAGQGPSICHATGSETNPYVLITGINVNGIINGHYDQHAEDIIPPFSFDGVDYQLNWDAEGQAIYNNFCELPAPPTPEPTAAPVTPIPTEVPVTPEPTEVPVTPEPTEVPTETPVTPEPTEVPATPIPIPATPEPTEPPITDLPGTGVGVTSPSADTSVFVLGMILVMSMVFLAIYSVEKNRRNRKG